MHRRIEITDREIMQCKTPEQALRMSLDRSDCSHKRMAIELGLSESHLSRALTDGDPVNLPQPKILQFMTICDNAIYLRWLYLQLKELLPELEHDDGACIASEVETLKLILREAIAEIKAALPPKCCDKCGAEFALVAERFVAPRWLLAEAVLIESEFGRVS